MSISLSVKLTKPMLISAVLPDVIGALQEILGLSFRPIVKAKGFLNRERVPLQSDVVDQKSTMILFEIVDERAVVGVSVYRRDSDHDPGGEEGVFATIDVSAWRSPLEYALAAAVAVAFGHQCDTMIMDYMPFYTRRFSQSADKFVKAIKVEATFTDYQTAGQAFYDSLPKGEITQ